MLSAINKGLTNKKRKKWVFYTSMVTLPILQFLVFYIYVNFNSIVLAFQKYDYSQGAYIFSRIDNFKQVFYDFQHVNYLQHAFKNSFLLYFFSLLFGSTLAVLFSYYIYKKRLGSEVFKVILFLPSIISSVVLVIMFNYFVERAIPFFVKKLFDIKISGLLSKDLNTAFIVLVFYNIWIGFGPQMLMYSGAMNNISDEIIESAHLDGVNPIKEFLFIVFPLIWKTFTTFIIVGIAGIFTNQMNLFSFYGPSADFQLYTIGYYLYKAIQSNRTTLDVYPYLSAMGITLTIAVIPVTVLVRYCMNKFGYSED